MTATRGRLGTGSADCREAEHSDASLTELNYNFSCLLPTRFFLYCVSVIHNTDCYHHLPYLMVTSTIRM